MAEVLRGAALATLLLDLLTPAEEAVDIETLKLRFESTCWPDRVAWTVDWLDQQPGDRAAQDRVIRRQYRRGGRPGCGDLAALALPKVRAATLLIVGGQDHEVLRLNSAAMAQMTDERKLEGCRARRTSSRNQGR